MAVVADTSSLNYLLLLDVIQILPELFEQILIPKAVSRELQSAATPPKVAAWMSRPPSWLRIETASPLDDEELEKLGAGEREAIIIALAHPPDALLLIDEGRDDDRPSDTKSVSWVRLASSTKLPRAA
jgi:predicted nucleic acid-binding protein